LPNRVIETERGQHLADEFGLKFFETSAKTGLGISELFLEMAKQIISDKPQLTASNQNQGV
jgi:Ras-related protein Rab-8A